MNDELLYVGNDIKGDLSMENRELLINDFSELISFVESLNDQVWQTPLGEGKWTTRDVIAHIMLWDEYFLEGAIEKISSHHPLTLKHTNFNEFNNNAVEFAKTKSKQELIDSTVHYRNEIIRHLNSLSEEDFAKEYIDGDGHPFSVVHYLKDFIAHDLHHINQIKSLIS